MKESEYPHQDLKCQLNGDCVCGMETKKLSSTPGHIMAYCPSERFVWISNPQGCRMFTEVEPMDYDMLVRTLRAGNDCERSLAEIARDA